MNKAILKLRKIKNKTQKVNNNRSTLKQNRLHNIESKKSKVGIFKRLINICLARLIKTNKKIMHTFKNKKRDITTDPTNINFFENFCHKT
jgi:hypothetical protein